MRMSSNHRRISVLQEEAKAIVFPPFSCELIEGILTATVSELAPVFAENLKGVSAVFINTCHGKLKLGVQISAKGFDVSGVKRYPSKKTCPPYVYPQTYDKTAVGLRDRHNQKANVYFYSLLGYGKLIPKRE